MKGILTLALLGVFFLFQAAGGSTAADDTLRFFMYSDPVVDNRGIMKYHDDDDTETLVSHLEYHPWRTEDPSAASVFVVPTVFGTGEAAVANNTRALERVISSPWFQRRKGVDHVVLMFNWQYKFFPSMIDRALIPTVSNMMQVRFEDFGCSICDKHIPARQRPINTLKGRALTYLDELDSPKVNRRYFQRNFCHQMTERAIVLPYTLSSWWMPVNEWPVISLDNWQKRECWIMFHTSMDKKYGREAVQLRQLVVEHKLQMGATGSCDSVIDDRVGPEVYIQDYRRSKFCVVTRGDTPTSHGLSRAISAGCIPLVISDLMPLVGAPLGVDLGSFAVFEPESSFIAQPDKVFHQVQRMSDKEISTMLKGLESARRSILFEHPESEVATRFIKEAHRMSQHASPRACDNYNYPEKLADWFSRLPSWQEAKRKDAEISQCMRQYNDRTRCISTKRHRARDL